MLNNSPPPPAPRDTRPPSGWRTAHLWLLLAALLGLPLAGRAQAPTWQSAVGISNVQVQSVATNAAGDVFITGALTGNATFGSTTLVKQSIGFGTDYFVAKWTTSTSTWAWARRGGDGNGSGGRAIAVSGSNVYVTGYFRANPGVQVPFGSTTFTGQGLTDMFVLKYIDGGTSVTEGGGYSGGGSGDELPTCVTATAGNVYVGGSSTSATGNISGVAYTTAGSDDFFLAKYTDSAGGLGGGWVVTGGGSGQDNLSGVAVSGNKVYATGGFISGTGAVIGGVSLPGAGGSDIFVARYLDGGTSVSNGGVFQAGGTGADGGGGVAVSGSQVYLTGSYVAGAGTSLSGTALTSGAGYVARYTENGTGLTNDWILTDNLAMGYIVTNGSSVFGTSAFTGTVNVAGTPLTSAGSADVVVAQYLDFGTSATKAGAVSGGGASYDQGLGIALSSGGKVVAAGIYQDTPTFGSTTLSGGGGGFFAYAKAPFSLVDRNPLRNANAFPRGGNITLIFNEDVDINTVTLRAFGAQQGGQLVGHGNSTAVTTAAGRVLTVNPNTDFAPGEVVLVTVPTAIASTGGTTLTKKEVYQFTAGVSNANTGSSFINGTDRSSAGAPTTIVLGDLDRDGDLDMLVARDPASTQNAIEEYFNNGDGTFTKVATLTGLGTYIENLTLADVNGNGTLDLIVSDYSYISGEAASYGSIIIRSNNGSGGFNTTLQTIALGRSIEAATLGFGDIDGDGDLDMVVPKSDGATVYTNNGSGTYTSSGSVVATGGNTYCATLADLDNDNDLDLLLVTGGTLNVRLNNGNGTFSGTGTVGVGATPRTVAAADLDGDGDLDVLVHSDNGVDLRFNNGNGTFSGTGSVGTGGSTQYKRPVTGDVDGDGDLDLLTLTATGVQVQRNNGSGSFAAGPALTLATTGLTLADVDGDGDLDVAGADGNNNLLNFRLNQAGTPTLTSLNPTSGPAGTTVTLTGTNFNGATAVSFNGTAATFTVVNSTSITTTVPAGATTGNVTVTTGSGTTSGISFTVIVPAPTLTSLSPTSGIVGASVTLTGTNFTSGSTVSFNGTAATSVTVNSATEIAATVPSGATTGNVTVTTANGTSGGVNFTVTVAAPAITSLNPNSGPVGTTVNLTGTGFTGTTAVSFNGTAATSFTVNSATSITAVVATGTTSGNLTVTTPAGTSSGVTFTVTVLPTLTTNVPANLTTTTADVGGTVATAGSSSVYGRGAVYSSAHMVPDFSDASAAATPTGLGSFTVTLTALQPGTTYYVRAYAGNSSGTGFGQVRQFTTIGLAPSLTSLSPTSGIVGTSVTLTGTNFIPGSTVSFNGTAATSVTVNSATSITAIVPSGTTTGNVTVTTTGGTTGGLSFTILASPPTITTLSPNFGPIGTQVTITGTNFVNGGTTVDFNGTVATTVVFNSSTEIVATVPVGTTDGDVTVTTVGGSASYESFTVTVPVATLTSLSPTSGAAGATITLTGTNFTGATAVRFNGASATYTVVSNTQITATVPAAATTGNVVVVNDGGTSNGLAFTVIPSITSINPGSGPVGTSLTLTGSNLTGAAAVNFAGGATATPTVLSSTSLTVTVPTGATTGNVTVTTPNGTTAGVLFTVTAAPMTVTARTPVRNARTAARSTNLALTFDRSLDAPTAANLRVFSQQRGGQLVRGGNATASGNTLTVDPANDLKAGETVFVTLPGSVTSSTGTPAPREVYQVTAATPLGNNLLTNSFTLTGQTPKDAAVGDLDGDGDLDFLLQRANNLTPYFNAGNGTSFTAGTAFSASSNNIFLHVILADVDNDGDLDALQAGYPTRVSKNNGMGVFSAVVAYGTANGTGRAVGVADVDADGDLDILTIVQSGSSTFSLFSLLNDGTGAFTQVGSVSTGITNDVPDLAVGDYNNDGKMDVAFCAYTDGGLRVLLGNGGGSFAAAPGSPFAVSSNVSANSIASADFNNDGSLDLVVGTNTTPGKLILLLNNGSGSFAPATGSPFTVGNRIQNLAVGDVNADGNADVLLANYATAALGAVSTHLGTGTGSFGTATNFTSTANSSRIAAGDFNADGAIDVVSIDEPSTTLNVLLNQATTPAAPTLTSVNPTSGAPGTTVTLTGTNFTSITNVSFNGTAVTGYTVVSSTSITTTVPTGATTGNVTVTTAGGTSNGVTFTVTPPISADLTISTGTAASPTAIAAGTYNNITVTGTGFAQLGGAVVANGAFTVQNGGGLDTNCQALTGPGSFTLAAGATLAICDAAGISGSGATGAVQVTASRSFSSDALYAYNGTVAQVTGSGLPATVRALTLGNAAGLTLSNALTATTTVALPTGVLALGAITLTLAPAATLSETATGYATGTVQTTRALATANAAESFGGLGLTLTPSGPTLPGSTLVRRVTGTVLTGAGTSQSVRRYFDIQPTTRTGLNVALVLTARDDERNGIAPANLRLFKSDDNGSTWQRQGAATLATATTSGLTTYSASLGSVSNFSLWTLGNAANPLPVELVAFAAERRGEAAYLSWTSASEKNSAYFEAEVSPDGTSFRPVGRVAAQGSTAQPHAYTLTDPRLLAYGMPLVYYRLRQVDRDGTFTYSPVRVLAVGGAAFRALAWPNPAEAGLTTQLQVSGPNAGLPIELTLTDAAGRVLAHRTVPAGAGALALPETDGRPAGVYLLRVQQGAGQQVLRLLRE